MHCQLQSDSMEEKEIGSNEKSKRGCVQLFNGVRQKPTLKPGISWEKEKKTDLVCVTEKTDTRFGYTVVRQGELEVPIGHE